MKPDDPVASGQTFTNAVNLPAGSYTIWCPVGNHRERGMEGTLTVAGLPRSLPNTGEADPGLPITAVAAGAGLLLVATGLVALRRKPSLR